MFGDNNKIEKRIKDLKKELPLMEDQILEIVDDENVEDIISSNINIDGNNKKYTGEIEIDGVFYNYTLDKVKDK